MNNQNYNIRADRRERARVVREAARMMAAEAQLWAEANPAHASGILAAGKLLAELSKMDLLPLTRKENLKTVRRELARFVPALELVRGDSDFEGEIILESEGFPSSPSAIRGIQLMLERGRGKPRKAKARAKGRKPRNPAMAEAFAKANG